MAEQQVKYTAQATFANQVTFEQNVELTGEATLTINGKPAGGNFVTVVEAPASYNPNEPAAGQPSHEGVNEGDILIVKSEITEGKTSHTAYVWDVNGEDNYWAAMDGNYNANNVYLAEDLYTYAPIGVATQATNNTIGSGSAISNTNPGKLANAGANLKTVFDSVFGIQQDVEPTINLNNVKLSANPVSMTIGSQTNEIGYLYQTSWKRVRLQLNVEGSAEYGYKYGTNSIAQAGSKFYYPIREITTLQVGGVTYVADLRITLPEPYYLKGNASGPSGTVASVEGSECDVWTICKKNDTTSESDDTAYKLAIPVAAKSFRTDNQNRLHLNLGGQQYINIFLEAGDARIGESAEDLWPNLTATVSLDKPRRTLSDETTQLIEFRTYQGNKAEDQSALNRRYLEIDFGSIRLSAGKYYYYYLPSTSSELSSDTGNPVRGATKFAEFPVSITCTEASHIWILMPPSTSGSKRIQYEPFANTWKDAFGGESDTTIGPVDVALRLQSGITETYKGYCTSAKAAAGTQNYKLV